MTTVFNESRMDCCDSFLEYSNDSCDQSSDSNTTADFSNRYAADSSLELIDGSASSSCYDCSEDGGACIEAKLVGSRKRKNVTPCRSSAPDDPNFRGVTISMENKVINSEWKLVINTAFSLSPRKKRQFKTYVDSSDEEDINNNYPPIHEEKHCASCSVKKTPLWRDAEDGTPLCNACGIRYKKYKLRCGTCWHIPKKDEFHPTCQYCGSFYEYVCPRR